MALVLLCTHVLELSKLIYDVHGQIYYLLKLLYIVGIYLDEYWFVGPSGRFTHGYVILNCLG